MLGVTAWWSFELFDRTPGWHPWLRYSVVIGGATVAGLVALGAARLPRALAAAVVAAGVLAGLGGPLAYTLDAGRFGAKRLRRLRRPDHGPRRLRRRRRRCAGRLRPERPADGLRRR
jgi:hypothetical protein